MNELVNASNSRTYLGIRNIKEALNRSTSFENEVSTAEQKTECCLMITTDNRLTTYKMEGEYQLDQLLLCDRVESFTTILDGTEIKVTYNPSSSDSANAIGWGLKGFEQSVIRGSIVIHPSQEDKVTKAIKEKTGDWSEAAVLCYLREAKEFMNKTGNLTFDQVFERKECIMKVLNYFQSQLFPTEQ